MKRDTEIRHESSMRFERDSNTRIDLNDLLRRNKIERKQDNKTNILILAATAAVSIIVVLIVSL